MKKPVVRYQSNKEPELHECQSEMTLVLIMTGINFLLTVMRVKGVDSQG